MFNIGTGTATSINELASKMIGVSGLELKSLLYGREQDSGVILESYADITKAKRPPFCCQKKSRKRTMRNDRDNAHIERLLPRITRNVELKMQPSGS